MTSITPAAERVTDAKLDEMLAALQEAVDALEDAAVKFGEIYYARYGNDTEAAMVARGKALASQARPKIEAVLATLRNVLK